MRIIKQIKSFRIVEILDQDYIMSDLMGDCYSPLVNSDIDPNVLKHQQKAFEKIVHEEGVYAYIVELWDPDIGCGWQDIDSCSGFVGKYSEDIEDRRHYIVAEYIRDYLEEHLRNDLT